MRIRAGARHCTTSIASSISRALIHDADHTVARTRSKLRAPKFWPTIGATEKATAMAGRKIACMTRVPTPKPACAGAPKGRITQ